MGSEVWALYARPAIQDTGLRGNLFVRRLGLIKDFMAGVIIQLAGFNRDSSGLLQTGLAAASNPRRHSTGSGIRTD